MKLSISNMSVIYKLNIYMRIYAVKAKAVAPESESELVHVYEI